MIAEIALATVLLAGAGLIVKDFYALLGVGIGLLLFMSPRRFIARYLFYIGASDQPTLAVISLC